MQSDFLDSSMSNSPGSPIPQNVDAGEVPASVPYLKIGEESTNITTALTPDEIDSLVQRGRQEPETVVDIVNFWSHPRPLQLIIAQICANTKGNASFVGGDRDRVACPVEALFRKIDGTRTAIDDAFIDSAILLAFQVSTSDPRRTEELVSPLFQSRSVRPPKLSARIERIGRSILRDNAVRQPISAAINDQSVDSDLMIPQGWSFNVDHNFTARILGRPGGEATGRIDGLPFVVKVFKDRMSGEQMVELHWWSKGICVSKIVPRVQLLRSILLEQLSGFGFPISCINSKLVVAYFSDYLRDNDFRLLIESHVRHLGWVGDSANPSFLLGDNQVSGGGSASRGDIIRFKENDPALAQLALGFRKRGTHDNCRAMLLEASAYPIIWFAILVSLGSVLLEKLNLPGFILDICGETSGGKTTALIVAASVWGNPTRNATDNVWHTWDNTPVFLERLAAIYHSLPMFLDDTRQASKPELISAVVYMLANGKSKGRGNKTGIDASSSWRLNVISTGEQSIVSFGEKGGVRARALTLRGSPFPDRNQEGRRAAEFLECLAAENYGHIGPEFVQRIIDEGNVPEWIVRINAIKTELSASFAQNSVAGRHLGNLALVTLTAELCCQWFGLPDSCRDPISGVRHLLLAEYDEADRPREALVLCHVPKQGLA